MASESSKFISNLSQFLQSKAHFQFEKEIQLIGHIHVQIDKNKTLDYVLNEFVDIELSNVYSNSFQAWPSKKSTAQPKTNGGLGRKESVESESEGHDAQTLVKRNDSGQTAIKFAPGSLIAKPSGSRQGEDEACSTGGGDAGNSTWPQIANCESVNPQEYGWNGDPERDERNEGEAGIRSRSSSDDADLESLPQLPISFQQEDFTIEINKETDEAEENGQRYEKNRVHEQAQPREQVPVMDQSPDKGLLPVKEEVVPAWVYDSAYQGAYTPHSQLPVNNAQSNFAASQTYNPSPPVYKPGPKSSKKKFASSFKAVTPYLRLSMGDASAKKSPKKDVSSSPHEKSSSKTTPKSQLTFSCDMCPYKCSVRQSLTEHVECHEDVEMKKYKCEHCYAGFNHGNGFTRHKKLHLSDSSSASLNGSANHDGSLFQLLTSTPNTSRNSSMGSPIKMGMFASPSPKQRKRQKILKYQCSYCPKAFDNSSSRRVHERIHTGEKPFKCEDCGAAYPQSSNLLYHKRKLCEFRNGKKPTPTTPAAAPSETPITPDVAPSETPPTPAADQIVSPSTAVEASSMTPIQFGSLN